MGSASAPSTVDGLSSNYLSANTRLFEAAMPNVDTSVFESLIPKIDTSVFESLIPKIDTSPLDAARSETRPVGP
jgi:hypothetical protein